MKYQKVFIIKAQDVIKALKRVEDGEARLVRNITFSHSGIHFGSEYCEESRSGIIEFVIDGKWRIYVFVDCGVWDYVDSVVHGAKILSHRILEKHYPVLRGYVPPLEVAQQIYQLEGVRDNIQHASSKDRKKAMR